MREAMKKYNVKGGISRKSGERMKVLLIGGGGTLGRAIGRELSARHTVIGVGRKSGEFHADMGDAASLEALFRATGAVDAIVCAAGSVHFGPWRELSAEKFQIGLQDKLMGQVQVVLRGQEVLADRGSFTLTSGVLSEDPIEFGACASLVNGALEAFVRAAPPACHEAFQFRFDGERIESFTDRMILLRADRD